MLTESGLQDCRKTVEEVPINNELMDDIRSKKDNIRYVLVFKMSRFARNTSDTAKYLQELTSYGIGLLGVKDGIDTSTATGKMIANIMGAVAEVELENIHEQTLAGRRHTVKVGGTNNETKAVKQKDERKIILVDGVHEAIVSSEMFAKAEIRLSENVRHRKTRCDSTTVYPLTGLIRCPDCGKNIFGYTAPPRPRKNGKEGFYPRYISYRCISVRDRNGVSCSLTNKYYSGTKLEKEVRDVVASMVTIPEFVELVSKKVDCATEKILKKKRNAVISEQSKYNGNLITTEKRLTELDSNDKHYERRVDSMNRILDDLYEKIDNAQSRLDEINKEISMAEKATMTKQSIFEMLDGFSKYYDIMTPEDKKSLLQAMISYIELYKEKRTDRHFVKAIYFTFPVTYDGESGALFVRTKEQQVECVALCLHATKFVRLL